MECTGIFRSKESVQPHLDAGAKAVLISAPGQEVDKTIVYGVNHNDLTKDDIVVSCASCTTNCLAPIAKIIMNAVGIRRGFMTTVHSYTQDQRILDNSHKDLYRARAAGLNMKFAAQGEMKGVICYSENALVSSDLNHDPNSATFAAPLTKVLDGHLVKIIAWYDNEWGFANRMIDVSREMGRHIKG